MDPQTRTATFLGRYWPLLAALGVLSLTLWVGHFSLADPVGSSRAKAVDLPDRRWEFFRFPVKGLSATLAIDREYSNRTFLREIVVLDHTRYVGCVFDNCAISWSGADTEVVNCILRGDAPNDFQSLDEHIGGAILLMRSMGLFPTKKPTTR
jgi:hypothetical protein